MSYVSFGLQECCSWCRQPVRQCRGASCDNAPTYTGALHQGQWVEVGPDELTGEGVRGHSRPCVERAVPEAAAAR